MRGAFLLSVLLLAACGGRGMNMERDAEPMADAVTAETTGGSDAMPPGDSAPTTDAPTTDAPTTDAPPAGDGGGGGSNANIATTLDCGRGTNGAGPGPNTAESMQRAEVDTRVFPDALCNDGSVAAIYFRPYRGEQNRNRWNINLRGGGSCSSGQNCAARWCGCTGRNVCPNTPEGTYTNFDRGNMIGGGTNSIPAGGIFRANSAAMPNPIGDYNQVRLVYCSSDMWSGARRAVPFTATHPVNGSMVNYTINFLGAKILDADFATLRQDGVRALTFTIGGANTAMPDLDDAQEIIINGDSGGGAGVINNLDRLATMLRANNTNCRGGTCPLVIRGLMDAIVGPDRSRLMIAPDGQLGMAGVLTAADLSRNSATFATAIARVPDESCVTWHRTNMPGTEHMCNDEGHLIRHHITTPFFVRMALRDSLISGFYFDAGFVDPMLGRFDREATVFARVLYNELSAFPMMQRTAEEGSSITTPPGVFAPLCTNHDTIGEDTEVYGVTITPTSGGMSSRLLDVFDAWRNGRMPSAVLSNPMENRTVCPPAM